MKPVYQEITEAGSGDCFSACLASLLEIPLADIPKFRRDNAEHEMMLAARKWLEEAFGMTIVTIKMPDDDDEIVLYPTSEGTPCIAAFASPNLENCNHAVVGQIDSCEFNFTVTHDPRRDGKKIEGRPKFLFFLVVGDLGKFARENRKP